MRAARTGVPSSVFAQDEQDVSAVAADETSVYWADRGGLIFRVEKGHPANPEVLARGQGGILAMAVDRIGRVLDHRCRHDRSPAQVEDELDGRLRGRPWGAKPRSRHRKLYRHRHEAVE